MNIKPIAILAAFAFLTGGCDKSPTTNNRDSQPPPPIQAEPFHGQVYKSLNGRIVLTLISKDECELNTGGTTLLCKYTKPNNTLRIVATALGTSQVIYYRFTNQGLEDNDGNILLSPEGYAATIAQLERKQHEEEKERERKQLEEQRVAQAIANSKLETQTIATFSLPGQSFSGFGSSGTLDPTLTITDVSLKWRIVARSKLSSDRIRNEEIPFYRIRKIDGIQTGAPKSYNGAAYTYYSGSHSFELAYSDGSYDSYIVKLIDGKSEAEAQTIHDTVLKAFNVWKGKFPEAVYRVNN